MVDSQDPTDNVGTDEQGSGGLGRDDGTPSPPLYASGDQADSRDEGPSMQADTGLPHSVIAARSVPALPLHTPSGNAGSLATGTDLDEEARDLEGLRPQVEGYVLASGCVHPWEQLEAEGSKAYAAFCCYRDMGYQRSTSAVARALGKHVALMQRWSTLYSWVDRARRYELYVDRERRARVEDQRLGMLDRHKGTAERIVELVDLWVEGKLRAAQKGEAVAIPDSQIAALLRVAAVVERQSLGLPADQTATVNEHRHRHTLEVVDQSVGTDGPGPTASPVQDWVQKLRQHAAVLTQGQTDTQAQAQAQAQGREGGALALGPGPAAPASAQVVDAVARDLGLDEIARELDAELGLDSGHADREG